MKPSRREAGYPGHLAPPAAGGGAVANHAAAPERTKVPGTVRESVNDTFLCLFYRLLPAGAIAARWDLHPLKIDAFHGA